ncbi:phage shock protein C (PspC) family protein [Micromonospora rhizosphaerae]|uniref:Phage shock protein C (PspC) family protein n=1 Tax=Micromonospora rhizosphaerae TaxID=568872 RepID=A0A1C6TJF8_9ACTN|nr:PspC domain-containing protein [Micromonospora rhizosphaerae]SCL12769.1 phage shock protein C (PspC) family protein [Micromonospora rhizosphaerae]SCL41881.1 phage shock protein C (PspC) family protein [Micromonospora rhizosphaerae]
MTFTNAPQAPYKQLRRPATDRMVAGVASGLGRYLGVDPTLVRVVFALATLATGGLAALAYPIMWFLMPEEPAGAPAWPHPAGAAPHGWPTPPASPPQAAGPAAQPWPTAPAGPAAAPEAASTPEPTPRPQPQPPTAG